MRINYKLKTLLYFLLRNKKTKVLFKFLEKILFSYFKKKDLKFLLSNKLFNFIQMFSKGKFFFLIKKKKNEFFLNEQKKNKENIILKNIFEKGYSEISEVSNKKIIDAQEYFKSKKIFDAHVPFDSKKKITYEQFLDDKNLNYGSYDIKTSFECPLISEIIFDKKILNIVSGYLLTN